MAIKRVSGKWGKLMDQSFPHRAEKGRSRDEQVRARPAGTYSLRPLQQRRDVNVMHVASVRFDQNSPLPWLISGLSDDQIERARALPWSNERLGVGLRPGARNHRIAQRPLAPNERRAARDWKTRRGIENLNTK